MGDERRFDEREVGLILKRVAELHEREGADTQAMTRTEIEGVVAELGISRALVSRAVSELSVQDVRNRPVWALGGKTDLMLEDVVDGRVDAETFTQMLEVLRRHLGDPGELKSESSVRIWSTTQTSRTIHFSVVERDDRTTLRLEERMVAEARATVGGMAGAGGFAGFLTVIPLKALVVKSVLMLSMGPLAIAGATVGWLGGRAVWKRVSARREAGTRRAFAEILEIARARSRRLAAT